ncbi:Uma2 family endonuclease [Lyngbya sp. CCAP 1446/10]|uniref:Uma2 family endonuclease n=1 Tax=Lyngbya sp. CCAP 1446/10 TaxID=439293 RepID=UPI002238BD62|nr:Uma2 family endonuclease [Lyngbya sp. CCAP 1446/10]MCW6053560.1 Uma2 family endonuclease [Lyngbya sp. CCAP 1446/10]
MTVSTTDLKITWQKLPADFILDEEPVENIDQPLLAVALREILEIAGFIVAGILIAPNMAICATLNNQLVVKAPDWFYARNVQPFPNQEIRRSYTPNLEGEIPDIVMEFVSATANDEYSNKRTYPPGKWFFYEQVLRVPIYAIFEPGTGFLEIYQLDSGERYQAQQPDANGRYWIAEVGLFLGVWLGTKAERTGYWLRWWDESGQMLLWGAEMVERERQEIALVQQEMALVQQEIALVQQEAEQERGRSQRLAAQLRAAGIEPEA